MERRTFLQGAAMGLVVPAVARAARSANERISLCVMGVHGRGGKLLSIFASLPNVDITHVCDVDSGVLDARVKRLTDTTNHRPAKISDYRQSLDDKNVDAL